MIAISSSPSIDIREYERFFDFARHNVATSIRAGDASLDVRVGDGMSGSRYLGVFNDEELVGIMNLWSADDEMPYRNIGRTLVLPKYQGHRITRQLIEWWVMSRDECLASDENQTAFGAGVWESMILRDPRLRFFLWRPDGSVTPVTEKRGNIVPNPWEEPNTRLIACPILP